MNLLVDLVFCNPKFWVEGTFVFFLFLFTALQILCVPLAVMMKLLLRRCLLRKPILQAIR
uniref:Uncharacterized protein n=1 Tax=Arundo donax TaxID=35708 RepID=A0A0A9FK21_ARUDO